MIVFRMKIIPLREKHLKKLIIRHININFLRSKFDLLIKQIKGNIDFLMISETKLDGSFPGSQFQIGGCSSPFRFDRNGNGGGIMLLVREDIPVKLIASEKLFIDSFYVELNSREQKYLINCLYNTSKTLIGEHLKLLSKNLDSQLQNMSLLFLLVIST